MLFWLKDHIFGVLFYIQKNDNEYFWDKETHTPRDLRWNGDEDHQNLQLSEVDNGRSNEVLLDVEIEELCHIFINNFLSTYKQYSR